MKDEFRKLRINIGSQPFVARATGWSVRTIQALESGQNPVRARHLLALAGLKPVSRKKK